MRNSQGQKNRLEMLPELKMGVQGPLYWDISNNMWQLQVWVTIQTNFLHICVLNYILYSYMRNNRLWGKKAIFILVFERETLKENFFYRCTMHSDIHTVHLPADAHLLKLWLQFTLKLDGSYIFWSMTIIRELAIEPG